MSSKLNIYQVYPVHQGNQGYQVYIIPAIKICIQLRFIYLVLYITHLVVPRTCFYIFANTTYIFSFHQTFKLGM